MASPADFANTQQLPPMDRAPGIPPTEGTPADSPDEAEGGAHTPNPDSRGKVANPNPPRTTLDGITSPKFGSAGSGGAELEPGPERD
jgi:hypothetical protein